jgi:hypothetical protein
LCKDGFCVADPNTSFEYTPAAMTVASKKSTITLGFGGRWCTTTDIFTKLCSPELKVLTTIMHTQLKKARIGIQLCVMSTFTLQVTST